VDRRAGHFWFSNLHRIGKDDLLCGTTLADDKAQGEWPSALYRSKDGGRSWKCAGETCYGPASVLLSSGKLLMMPYELWPLTKGERRNAKANGTIVARKPDGSVAFERAPVKFLGWPRDLADYNVDELCMATNGNILPLRDGRLFMTTYGRFQGEEKYCVFAVTSADGGLTWNYLSTVARWQDTPDASEGPDESNTARLPSGRLLCVYRVGSGQDFHKSYSADEGVTWTKPERMEGVWSVEPQLTCLETGLLLLSGGRLGLYLWVCADRNGGKWERVNLAEHHNALVSDASLRYPDEHVQGKYAEPAQSTSYTGMALVGPDEVLVSYDRLGNGWAGAPGPWGEKDAIFCVRVKAERKS
jgi:hypothetical protein